MSVCSVCEKILGGNKGMMSYLSCHCNEVFYCSGECAVRNNHFKNHQAVCGNPRDETVFETVLRRKMSFCSDTETDRYNYEKITFNFQTYGYGFVELLYEWCESDEKSWRSESCTLWCKGEYKIKEDDQLRIEDVKVVKSFPNEIDDDISLQERYSRITELLRTNWTIKFFSNDHFKVVEGVCFGHTFGTSIYFLKAKKIEKQTTRYIFGRMDPNEPKKVIDGCCDEHHDHDNHEKTDPNETDQLQCSFCKIQKKDMKTCAGCHSKLYCSSVCQLKDWENHKTECKQKSKN